ncbi:hypothetical protein Pint_15713 [Pistacia integerrima]|uniref:Uncharacterized protein n=1 Tax=Pistacia integerrima TaxID=434235 RepID=A0ACC0ZD11_9ROSI|nr:hypothetical protein Pint_15713 [Pistacia integerrima]
MLLQRPFICSIDDFHASYRRKNHLTHNLIQHQGKLFTYPIENCNREFTIQSNMKRHVNKFHDEDCSSFDVKGQKQCIGQEAGCGKIFKYKSKLQKHKESYVKLDSTEAFCSKSRCMKYFTNKECLVTKYSDCLGIRVILSLLLMRNSGRDLGLEGKGSSQQ